MQGPVFTNFANMTKYEVKDSELEALCGKMVLVIGAASGIDRATVLLAHRKDCLPLLVGLVKCRVADIPVPWYEKVMALMLRLATGTMRRVQCLQRV